MQYVIGEIWLSLVGAALLAGALGWLLNRIMSQSKQRAIDTLRNLQLEELQGQLESERIQHKAVAAQIETLNAKAEAAQLKAKEAEERVQLAFRDGAESARRLGLEIGALKSKVAALSGLESQLAERDQRIEAWQVRFDGVIAEKDRAILARSEELARAKSASPAMISEYQGKLAEMGAALAAATAARDGLEAQLADHRGTLETLQNHLQATIAQKDAELARALRDKTGDTPQTASSAEPHPELAELRNQISEAHERHAARVAELESVHRSLQAALAEANARVIQRDEDLRSFDNRMRASIAEKDTVIGRLRSLAARVDPMRAELEQRDRAIEQMQQRLSSQATTAAAAASESASLAEVRREVDSLRATVNAKDSQIAMLRSELEAATVHKAGATLTDGAQSEAQRQLHSTLAAYQSLKLLVDGKDARLSALEGQLALAETEPAQAADLAGRHAAAQSEIDEQANTIAKLHASMQALADEKTGLANEIAARDSRISALEAELRELDSKFVAIAPASGQAADLAGRHAAAQAALDEQTDTIAKLHASMQALLDEKTGLANEIAARDSRISALEADLRELDSKFVAIAPASGQAADLAGRHAAAQAALNEQADTIAKLHASMQALTDEKTGLANEIAARDSRISALEADLRELDSKFVAMAPASGQAADLAGRHAAAQSEIDEQATTISEFQARIKELENEKTGLASEVASRDNQIHLLQKVVRDLDERFVAAAPATTQAVDLAAHHAAAQNMLQQDAEQMHAIESQLRALRDERDALSGALASRDRLIDSLHAEIVGLDNNLTRALDSQRRIQSLEASLAEDLRQEQELRATLTSREQEITDLRSQITDRDEQLEAWELRFNNTVANAVPLAKAVAASATSATSATPAVPVAPRTADAAPAPVLLRPPKPGGPSRAESASRLRTILESNISASSIQFLPSSAELIPESLPVLEEAAEAMHQYPDSTVEIAGHTDSWGEPEDNFKLSQQRANAVREYLINRGIAAWRLIDIGYGDTRPIASNDTADGRFANRRIEFHVRH